MTKTLQKVSMELGATINMGNYQSLKVSIGGEMNILPGGTREDCYDELQEHLVDELIVRVDQLKEELREYVYSSISYCTRYRVMLLYTKGTSKI